MKIFQVALKKAKAALVLPAAVLLVAAMPVAAAQITYIHTGHGSGTLNGQAFDADFAINAVADTANVTACGSGCLTNDNIAATIYIDSLGVFSFITPTRYFLSGVIGLARTGLESSDLFDGPALAAWDMASSLEPVIGTANLLQWGLSDVLTTGGVLVFDSGATPSVFTAAVSEIPLPAGAWLLGSGLIGLAGCARRRARTS